MMHLFKVIYVAVLTNLFIFLYASAGTSKRLKFFQDLDVSHFDADGEIKQLRYGEILVEKSPPIICFLHKPTSSYIMLACNRRRSKLDLAELYQRIFRLSGMTFIGFIGHSPDWSVIKHDIFRYVILVTRQLGMELETESIAQYISRTLSRMLFQRQLSQESSSGATAADDQDSDDTQSSEQDWRRRLPIGNRLDRPLAAYAIMPNSGSNLLFWKIGVAGKYQSAETVVLGNVNSFLENHLQLLREKDDDCSPTENLISMIEDIIEFLEGFDLFELAVVSPSTKRYHHILPTSKSIILARLSETLDIFQ